MSLGKMRELGERGAVSESCARVLDKHGPCSQSFWRASLGICENRAKMGLTVVWGDIPSRMRELGDHGPCVTVVGGEILAKSENWAKMGQRIPIKEGGHVRTLIGS